MSVDARSRGRPRPSAALRPASQAPSAALTPRSSRVEMARMRRGGWTAPVGSMILCGAWPVHRDEAAQHAGEAGAEVARRGARLAIECPTMRERMHACALSLLASSRWLRRRGLDGFPPGHRPRARRGNGSTTRLERGSDAEDLRQGQGQKPRRRATERRSPCRSSVSRSARAVTGGFLRQAACSRMTRETRAGPRGSSRR